MEDTASFWKQQSCDHGPGPQGSELISWEVIGFPWRHGVFRDQGWTRFFLPGRHLVLNQGLDAPTSCPICLNHWVNGLFTDVILSPGKHASHPGCTQLLRAWAGWIPEFPMAMAKMKARRFRPNVQSSPIVRQEFRNREGRWVPQTSGAHSIRCDFGISQFTDSSVVASLHIC